MANTAASGATRGFREARDLLLARREELGAAVEAFRWPELPEFNWAADWFDVVAAEHPDRAALRIVEEDGRDASYSYAEMADRSARLASWLYGLGVRRGDRLLLMLGNQVELWDTVLAAIRLGAVTIPATTLLGPADIEDRIVRGQVAHVVTAAEHTERFGPLAERLTRVSVGSAQGWHNLADSASADPAPTPGGPTRGDDPMLLYFTSGTTSLPKLVEHTHVSYPVGHLSTMYWLGLQPGDVHLNISSPGWAKHAWSNVFAPWNAEATVLVVNYARFRAEPLLDQLVRCGVSTFCAPPTVWRMLIQADLGRWRVPMRELVAAGEPLNPEVIEQVRAAWGLTVRDGYGQTETTAVVGNTPGQPVVPGSMGRPLPGYAVALVDPATGRPGDDGEICLDLSRRPAGLMTGYRDSTERTADVMRDGYYHTGDVARRDPDGSITYVGRTDDVFKASDYRISPFELESVLVQHEAVVEAAVVPSPDPLRLAVPKAYVTLAAGWAPDAETARSILRHCRENLAPYKRVRRLEFGELPKTISGKIRRVELRTTEEQVHSGGAADARTPGEFRDEDFPDLRG
ncbi:MAG: AMP-binding protein [Kineosporiaceae bacterium]